MQVWHKTASNGIASVCLLELLTDCLPFADFFSSSPKSIRLKSEKKMTNETPPTIAMALVNPQMPSISADGKNSSTQQLSISVWVTFA